ncbi:unknown [Roseburia sp. CAG:309]|nr:unknown [Roseburia sp. CAG:309]
MVEIALRTTVQYGFNSVVEGEMESETRQLRLRQWLCLC